MENYNTSSISKFYDANEGYIKGNLCKETYKPYKNYVPKEIKTKNDQEGLLLFIQKCDLAIQDLSLYLDINPSDEKVLKMLNFYKEEFNKAKETYLNAYGPLYPCQVTAKYVWNEKKFPWEN